MSVERFEVMIEIAGGLLWLAPRSLGGLTPQQFSQMWLGGGAPESLESLIQRGCMMPLSLYQDDGYSIRFVQGELTQQEREEWTAHSQMNLEIPCGELLVSGVLTPDFAELEFPQMGVAEPDAEYQLGCYLQVEPGSYRVDVYSYPPGDLSGAWGHIVDSDTFGRIAGLESETAERYFERTRPDILPPAWINDQDDGTFFLSFLIQVTPHDATLPAPLMGDDGVGVAWEFRKPEKCPLGIRRV